jgi:hypothetical protein
MTSKEAQERKLKEIQEIAAGWGKMIAREAFPQSPGLNVTLADMEEIAVAAIQGPGQRGGGGDDGRAGEAVWHGSALPNLSATMPPPIETAAGGCARRHSHLGGAGGPLPDVSSGFFSLSVWC